MNAKNFQETFDQQKQRRKRLLDKVIQPRDENDHKLMKLTDKDIDQKETQSQKRIRTTYKTYKEAKSELKDHRKEMKANGEQDTSRIYVKSGRYYQWWDRLPTWMEQFQPVKEKPEDVYREIRKMLVLDLNSLNHVEFVALLERYK